MRGEKVGRESSDCRSLNLTPPLERGNTNPQWRLLGGQSGFDGSHHFGRIRNRAGLEALEDLAIAANQEFAEIPLDVARVGGFLARESGIEGMAFGAIDVDFIEEGKADIVFAGAKLFDFLIRPRFLAAKLIARKAKHDQPLLLIFFMDRFKGFVLRGEPALRSDVYNQEHLALIIFQGGVLAIDVLDRDFMDGTGEKSHSGEQK